MEVRHVTNLRNFLKKRDSFIIFTLIEMMIEGRIVKRLNRLRNVHQLKYAFTSYCLKIKKRKFIPMNYLTFLNLRKKSRIPFHIENN